MSRMLYPAELMVHMAAPGNFGFPPSESESDVLPLDEGAICLMRIRRCRLLRPSAENQHDIFFSPEDFPGKDGSIGDLSGARTRKLQDENLVTLPICL